MSYVPSFAYPDWLFMHIPTSVDGSGLTPIEVAYDSIDICLFNASYACLSSKG